MTFLLEGLSLGWKIPLPLGSAGGEQERSRGEGGGGGGGGLGRRLARGPSAAPPGGGGGGGGASRRSPALAAALTQRPGARLSRRQGAPAPGSPGKAPEPPGGGPGRGGARERAPACPVTSQGPYFHALVRAAEQKKRLLCLGLVALCA